MPRKPASPNEDKPLTRRQPPRAKLHDEARAFIVVQLACYRTLEAIRRDVKNIYGIEVSVQAISHYDPTTRTQTAGKWEDLFYSARTKYLEDVQRQPLAYQAYRLQMLQEGIDAARPILTNPLVAGEGENAAVIASPLDAAEQIRKIVETASKELGGVFTNVKKGSIELTGSVAITGDEKRNVLEDKMREIIEARFVELKPVKQIQKDAG